MQPDEDTIVRHTYTRARRYTQWVRWIMGWELPVALHAAQFIAGVGALIALIYTRPLWGPALPWWGQVLVIVAVPVVLAIAARYLRTDGTGPAAVLTGLIVLSSAPIRGRCNGRTVRTPRARRIPAAYSLLAHEDTAVVAPAAATAYALAPRPAQSAHRTPEPLMTPRGVPDAPARAPRPLTVAEVTRAAQALAAGQFRNTELSRQVDTDDSVLLPAAGQ